MRTLRNLLFGLLSSSVWPAYLGLGAYAARQAPWPRSFAVLSATLLASLALAGWATNVARWTFGDVGWAASGLEMPPEVCRPIRCGVYALIAASLVALLPALMVSQGMLAPEGRPVAAPNAARVSTLGFELVVFAVAVMLLRKRSAVLNWLTDSPERLGRFSPQRRAASLAVLAGVAAVIVLDARGYSHTAQRLAGGAIGSLADALLCWGLYRVLRGVVDKHAWRWARMSKALRGRGEPDAAALPDDLAGRLRRLGGGLVALVGVLLGAWVWNVDLALFRFLGEQSVWTIDAKEGVAVTLGDLAKGVLSLALCAAAWRHMSTFFAVVVFPRIPDDPGIRFALVTLCRYAVLGVGLLCGLSSVHLGLEKIGVVLAALGVGLGFGLQEIVSNFVCGIILLLERPIRVGDIVTVSGMTGKVDRINIRATSIINAENQSIIVPNRAFVTSDLVNWTLKDKVIRVSLRIKVARGTDPDRVSELLLAIVRDDPDALRNPVPTALVEEFTDNAMVFALNVHVPEPGLAGRIKHRLFGQIQKRFEESNVPLALPVQELYFKSSEGPGFFSQRFREPRRWDAPSPTPPPPIVTVSRRAPEPLEECHRGVDE